MKLSQALLITQKGFRWTVDNIVLSVKRASYTKDREVFTVSGVCSSGGYCIPMQRKYRWHLPHTLSYSETPFAGLVECLKKVKKWRKCCMSSHTEEVRSTMEIIQGSPSKSIRYLSQQIQVSNNAVRTVFLHDDLSLFPYKNSVKVKSRSAME
jgi:hypothetical protein